MTLPATEVEDIQHDYAYGDCAVFAAAMGRRYGIPLVEFYDAGGEMFHVAAALPCAEDRFLDVFGEVSFDDVTGRYGALAPVRVESRTERELHQFSIFGEQDVQAALADLEVLVVSGVLPGMIGERLRVAAPRG